MEEKGSALHQHGGVVDGSDGEGAAHLAVEGGNRHVGGRETATAQDADGVASTVPVSASHVHLVHTHAVTDEDLMATPVPEGHGWGGHEGHGVDRGEDRGGNHGEDHKHDVVVNAAASDKDSDADSASGSASDSDFESESDGEADAFEIPKEEWTPPIHTIRAERQGGSMDAYLNEYHMGHFLGKGSFADVWLSRAIKAIDMALLHRRTSRLRSGQSVSDVAKVDKEIELMETLRHRNIVRLLEVIAPPHRSTVHMVLEYADAGVAMSWSHMHHRFESAHSLPHGGLAEQAVRQIVSDVCHALVYLHRHGIVHRDIKPENIFLFSDGTCKLGDFGVAHQFSEEHRRHGLHSETEGTSAFHPPECVPDLASVEEVSHFDTYKVDMWAVGVTMFVCLTGKLPFPSQNPLDMFEAIRTTRPSDTLSALIQTGKLAVSPAAVNLVAALLDKDPARRPTARQVLKHPFILHHVDDAQRMRFAPVMSEQLISRRLREATPSRCCRPCCVM